MDIWGTWNARMASPTGLVVPDNTGDVWGHVFGHQASRTRPPEAVQVDGGANHQGEERNTRGSNPEILKSPKSPNLKFINTKISKIPKFPKFQNFPNL